jgi:hypothetical protein
MPHLTVIMKAISFTGRRGLYSVLESLSDDVALMWRDMDREYENSMEHFIALFH